VIGHETPIVLHTFKRETRQNDVEPQNDRYRAKLVVRHSVNLSSLWTEVPKSSGTLKKKSPVAAERTAYRTEKREIGAAESLAETLLMSYQPQKLPGAGEC
jgi:hypothetical protein